MAHNKILVKLLNELDFEQFQLVFEFSCKYSEKSFVTTQAKRKISKKLFKSILSVIKCLLHRSH